jgi:hypothetical protein
MSLTVVEVLERSKQGRTEPYICRCDDGVVYFVKGRSATRFGLIAEWLCAQLGEAFGLPIAPYAIAMVPEELIEADLTGWLGKLGEGEVFASERIGAVELTETHRELVSQKLRQDVIAFDWWVHNGDRNMTPKGGNPNLLWNPKAEGSLVVIDHNLAFDSEFSASDFLKLHVFADDIPGMFSDFLLRVNMQFDLRILSASGMKSAILYPPPGDLLILRGLSRLNFQYLTSKYFLTVL